MRRKSYWSEEQHVPICQYRRNGHFPKNVCNLEVTNCKNDSHHSVFHEILSEDKMAKKKEEKKKEENGKNGKFEYSSMLVVWLEGATSTHLQHTKHPTDASQHLKWNTFFTPIVFANLHVLPVLSILSLFWLYPCLSALYLGWKSEFLFEIAGCNVCKMSP